MPDFLKMLFERFQEAAVLALLALIVYALVLAAWAHIRKKKHPEKKFPWKTVIVGSLFAGYLVALFGVTLLRTYGLCGVNLHLFRAWREAWNSFTLKAMLNPILNTLMFVPFGLLLPLVWKKCNRVLPCLLSCFALTLMIETLQLLTNRGIFDVDDLFCNTLGGVMGFCLYGGAVSFREKSKIKGLLFSAVPVAAVVFVLGAVGVYHFQPYGNLPDAPFCRQNTSAAQWQLDWTPETTRQTVPMYKGATLTKESAEQLGREMLERLGYPADRVDYYDESLFVFHQIGNPYVVMILSYNTAAYTLEVRSDNPTGTMEEGALRQMLQNLGIELPENATLEVQPDDTYCFTADGELSGTVTCRVDTTGSLTWLENCLIRREEAGKAQLLSQAEAVEKLEKGWFTGYAPAGNVSVGQPEIEYETDTKGFLQPVYVFTLTSGGSAHEARVPALG